MGLWTILKKEGSTIKKSAFKDNRGLTLVELMVGVTILAIIAIPLLNAFVVGAGTEVKSRKYGDATDAAQNLIEQIQAYDADLILTNSTTIDSGALFYASSNLSTGNNGVITAPVADAGKYYVGIKNYSYGGSSFDALITLDASNSINGTPVVVGNQMDASLDMSQADTNAVNALQAECGDLVASASSLTINSLTRSITLNVTKPTNLTTYKIDAVFAYTAVIPYTVVINKIPYNYNYSFTYTDQSSASVANVVASADNSPVFSVFMFYDAYYRSDMETETILINNQPEPSNNDTRSDINFFIINTNTDNPPPKYKAILWYKYQKFDDNKPVNNLVFTNLPPVNVEYRASKSELLRKTLIVTGYLAETKQLNRKYNVNVKLFKGGSGFTGTPVFDIDSTKLNY